MKIINELGLALMPSARARYLVYIPFKRKHLKLKISTKFECAPSTETNNILNIY